MGMRGRELVAADESTVVAKPSLDTIMVENSKRDGGFADSPGTDESDWNKVLCGIDHLLYELITSEEGSWRQRRGFSRCARFELRNGSVGKLDHRPCLSLGHS